MDSTVTSICHDWFECTPWHMREKLRTCSDVGAGCYVLGLWIPRIEHWDVGWLWWVGSLKLQVAFAECILFYCSHPISTIGVVSQTHMSRMSHVTHAFESCHAYDGVMTTHTHQISCVTHILLPILFWQKQPTKLAFVTNTKKSTSSGTSRHAGSLFEKQTYQTNLSNEPYQTLSSGPSRIPFCENSS